VRPVIAWLTYLEKASEALGGNRILQPANLSVGDKIPLGLHHPQRWRRQDVTRVILGSKPTWADVVLVDGPLTIRREHARVYLNHQAPEQSDFRAMKGCPVVINGVPHPPFECVRIQNGDDIQLSCWRFRYEWTP
jgi:hypothetical protein